MGRRATWRVRAVGRVGAVLLVALGLGTAVPGSAVAAPAPPVWGACTGSLVASAAGPLSDPALREVSGVVASRARPGVWWVHNDSGDTARVFAVGSDGVLRGEYALAGVTARDWEDLAVGPGPQAGVAHLYVGDIGDNSAVRPSVRVHRFAEPVVPASGPVVRASVGGVASFDLVYPSGPRDAEALLVDPVSGAIVIVTKSVWGAAEVYRAPGGRVAGSTTRLTRVGSVPGVVTGGDVTPAGDVVALRTYTGVRLYRRPAGTRLEAAFSGVSCAAQSVPEPQGEAVGFTADGRGYVTVSEGTARPLNRFTARP